MLVTDFSLSTEYNFGNASHPRSRKDFGGFVGFGVGSNNLPRDMETSDLDGLHQEPLGVAGILINLGFRVKMGNLPYGIRLSFLYESAQRYTFGTTLFFTFGKY